MHWHVTTHPAYGWPWIARGVLALLTWVPTVAGDILQGVRMQAWERISFQSPSVCIMSGMSGEEQVAVAEVWQQFVGSTPPIFGAVLPQTAKQPVRTVVKVSFRPCSQLRCVLQVNVFLPARLACMYN